MSLPAEGTTVTYPAGTTSGAATVLHVEPDSRVDAESPRSGMRAVILDVSPCHPVDSAWPDQPADRGTLTWNGGSAQIEECIVAATDGEALYLGSDVPVRKGTDGWTFLVAFITRDAPAEGTVVTVETDKKFRAAISAGHTGCHLASLALNRALSERWSKEVAQDALGSPDFDGLACESSHILEGGSLDTFRLGKSLRKKGFQVEGLAEDLAGVEVAVNTALARWVAQEAPVRIERDGDRLTDRRSWVCDLAEGSARIACGGTHCESLGALHGLTATLSLSEVEGTPVLTMSTMQS